MSYELNFTDKAKADLRFLKKSEPQAYKKAQKLIGELEEHPRPETGKPSIKKHNLSGHYPRKITDKHRLLYSYTITFSPWKSFLLRDIMMINNNNKTNMKNTTFFAVFGLFIGFIPMETKAKGYIKPERTENLILTNNKTTFQMKEGTISDLVELLSSYGNPKTKEQIDSWRDFGKTFDLYRYPSDKPLAKNTHIFIYDKEHETEESKKRLKNLELVYTGENCIAVMLNVFGQVKKPSIKIFVEALNYYKEKGEFLKIKP